MEGSCAVGEIPSGFIISWIVSSLADELSFLRRSLFNDASYETGLPSWM